ncbi:unnamed protein product [Pleuronectes platessa]|uniref:Uncharacterized protein n=1 Tax=Pleuronectes platessa TaxID=8262 RepID=A0A9N7V7Z4_PLEPL|nr:unnamed protein product [Pleuronectes platessa]
MEEGERERTLAACTTSSHNTPAEYPDCSVNTVTSERCYTEVIRLNKEKVSSFIRTLELPLSNQLQQQQLFWFRKQRIMDDDSSTGVSRSGGEVSSRTCEMQGRVECGGPGGVWWAGWSVVGPAALSYAPMGLDGGSVCLS